MGSWFVKEVKRDDPSRRTIEGSTPSAASTRTGPGPVNLYVHGVCEDNGTLVARSGIGVFFGDGHVLNVGHVDQSIITNQQAALLAAIIGLRECMKTGSRCAYIHTNSEYLMNVGSHWSRAWVLNGFKLADGSDVANVSLVKELHDMIYGGAYDYVRWVYERKSTSHGILMAHNLARNAVNEFYRP